MNNYTRNSRRSLVYLTVAALGLPMLSEGCKSDPIADRRFQEYSTKTLVSATTHDRAAETSYVKGLKLKAGDDGVSFVVYKLETKNEKGEKNVVSPEKAAQILEASILKGKGVSGRKFNSHPNLEACVDALKTEEDFFKAQTLWVEGTTTTKTAAVREFNVKEEGLGKKVIYDTKSPIAVIDVKTQRVVGLYKITDAELLEFAKEREMKVGDLTNLLNGALYADNEKLRNSVKEVLRQKMSEEETDDLMENTGGTLAYLFDSEYEESVVEESSKLFNNGTIGAHDLAKILRSPKKKVWLSPLAFDHETLEPVFPETFGRSYALKMFTTKDGKVKTEVVKKPKKN